MKNKFTVTLCAMLMACVSTMPMLPAISVHAESVSASMSAQDYSDAVVSLVNQERAAQGLSPLKAVPVLNSAAEIRSQETITLFSHTRPDGRSCSTVLDDLGVSWRTTGENIAYGYNSPEAVMNGWMNSSGHRANILSSNYDSIGVGVVSHNGTLYWTQVFTGGAEYSDAYVPEFNPSVPDSTVNAPEVDTNVPSSDICIGDSCFNLSGTDCTVPQNILSCLTGDCNAQELLSCLTTGNCNAQDVLSALNQNGNCNAQDVLSALNQNGNCNTQDILSALNQNGNCNVQDVLSALNQNCNNSNILSVFSNSCK